MASADMVKISDRFEDFAQTSSLSPERLSILHCMCIPADGRIRFVNFLHSFEALEAAIIWYEDIQKIQGVIEVVDFDAHGNSVSYGQGAQLEETAVTIPKVCWRENYDFSGPWKRLMYVIYYFQH